MRPTATNGSRRREAIMAIRRIVDTPAARRLCELTRDLPTLVDVLGQFGWMAIGGHRVAWRSNVTPRSNAAA
jgi:hypothetical protein